MARFRRRFFRPECTFGAEALDDPVGLHSVSDDVPVGIGCGDLGKGEFLAASGSARMTEQVTPLGGAGVLMLIATVAARVPLSKSWFDQAAAAPAVSITDAITPP
ncbi:Uncharacterised protein [Mycobacterium tuberculosis]|nr:Uncharacterised protein [Mycobacterium tuberculosis]